MARSKALEGPQPIRPTWRALKGIKCSTVGCPACAEVEVMTRKLVDETSRDDLVGLLDQVLVEVPLHSIKTAIVLAVKQHLMEPK
jgi:hypothetical protein